MKTNFIGRSAEYHNKCNLGGIPKALENLRNSIRWPIDLDTPSIHLACYYGQRNYSDPGFGKRHRGLDLQVPLDTQVASPSSGRVVFHRNDLARGLTDVAVYCRVTGLLYVFAHLNTDNMNLPETSRFLNWNSSFEVSAGQTIGHVGKWPYILGEKVKIPPEVSSEYLYGRSFNHLHLETHYYPKMPGVNRLESLRARFNPLML